MSSATRRRLMAAAPLVALALSVAGCGERPSASPVVAPTDAEDVKVGRDQPQQAAPTTTTTTAPPPTTTTTTAAPAPPPTIQAARRPAPPPAPAPPPPPVPDPNGEARALQLVNAERAKAGVAPLQLSSGARSVARAWSVHMAGSGLAHNADLGGDLDRAGVSGWRSCAENVGYSRSVDEVHSLFMGSATHRGHLLDPAFSQVGIGVVGAGGKVWVTMDLVGY